MRHPVKIVGAGPGDPELLTVKALRAIEAAEIILHDDLVSAPILALAPASARRIDVGKRCGRFSATQSEINRLLAEHARTGARLVRLKGGDPSVFGRLAEETGALRQAGIAFEIIPGITAAAAAAASLGTSLTRRGIARTLHFVTGHGAEDGLPAHDWTALTRAGGTLAVYMGRQTVRGLAAHLIEAGMRPDLPAIAVQNASLPTEYVARAELSTLGQALERMHADGPTLILLGEALDEAKAATPRSAAEPARGLAGSPAR